MNSIITENSGSAVIPFQAGDAYVDLTKMCKAVGKGPHHFFELETTKEFIQELRKENLVKDVIIGVRGRNGGTWAHPDLALECARWLSPKFAIWTNRVIRRILSGESTIESEATKLREHVLGTC